MTHLSIFFVCKTVARCSLNPCPHSTWTICAVTLIKGTYKVDYEMRHQIPGLILMRHRSFRSPVCLYTVNWNMRWLVVTGYICLLVLTVVCVLWAKEVSPTVSDQCHKTSGDLEFHSLSPSLSLSPPSPRELLRPFLCHPNLILRNESPERELGKTRLSLTFRKKQNPVPIASEVSSGESHKASALWLCWCVEVVWGKSAIHLGSC